jgi:hypothetical protein
MNNELSDAASAGDLEKLKSILAEVTTICDGKVDFVVYTCRLRQDFSMIHSR